MDSGWTWQAAVGAVVLGNVVVLVPIALNSHAGTRYGIPFPVLARASFGVLGANVPALLRGLVACGWFGIQTWIGGWAIYKLIEVLWPGIATLPQILPAFVGLNTGEFLCFMVFWAMNVWIVLRGMESIKFLETWGSPFLLAVGAALFIWAWARAGGLGPMLENPAVRPSGGGRPATVEQHLRGRTHLARSRSGARWPSRFPTSPATRARNAIRSSARPWACRERWRCSRSSARR